jgi:putative Mg2+ transporter-C (MgtC) family protein
MSILDFNQFQILAQVALAVLLGALIGVDREMARKPAGLRTHMLVAGAATVLVALSSIAVEQLGQELGDSLVRTDPIRIIEAVITGVSFLGAGTIIVRRAENQVEGLTTAASLLMAAAIGVCVALTQWILAIGITVLVLISLRGINYLTRRIEQQWEQEPSS